MNSQEKNRIYLNAKHKVRQKNIFWRDLINFLVFSFIFFGFNMVFTPGLWWSIIPIGFYALIIVATHSGRVQELWEEKALTKEIKRLKHIEKQKASIFNEVPIQEQEKSLLKPESYWDENEIV